MVRIGQIPALYWSVGFLLKRFETLLPLAAKWASEQEKRILRDGVPLSEQEISDAKAVGVRDPCQVRLLRIEAIPSPRHPLLRIAQSAINLLTSTPRGLTLQHGIFVRSDCWRDRALIVHELAHTAQYERLGGILPFLRKYLFECATVGYRKSPMEREAAEMAARICSL
jgi:hypothetical protein